MLETANWVNSNMYKGYEHRKEQSKAGRYSKHIWQTSVDGDRELGSASIEFVRCSGSSGEENVVKP